MSKKTESRRIARELNTAEMDKVGGGLTIRGGGVTIKQRIPIPVVLRTVKGLL